VTPDVHLDVHPKGYRLLRVETSDGRYYVAEHRLVAFAHCGLDSPFFAEDSREVHHIDGAPESNHPANLEPLTSKEHGETTRAADLNGLKEAEGVEYLTCPNCDEGRPHHRLTDGTLRCVVCRHPTDGPDVEQAGGRVSA